PKTLQPFSSMSKTDQPRFTLVLGRYVLPLSSAHIRTFRKGQAFWKVLSDRGIPVTVIHMPTNFPPIEAGEALAGMGTPDLRGTLGTFTYYTDDPEELTRPVSGGNIVKVRSENGRFVLPVEGPPNTLIKQQPFAKANLVADVDPVANVALISVD